MLNRDALARVMGLLGSTTLPKTRRDKTLSPVTTEALIIWPVGAGSSLDIGSLFCLIETKPFAYSRGEQDQKKKEAFQTAVSGSVNNSQKKSAMTKRE